MKLRSLKGRYPRITALAVRAGKSVSFGFLIALGFALFGLVTKEANELTCDVSEVSSSLWTGSETHFYRCKTFGHYSILGPKSFIAH